VQADQRFENLLFCREGYLYGIEEQIRGQSPNIRSASSAIGGVHLKHVLRKIKTDKCSSRGRLHGMAMVGRPM